MANSADPDHTAASDLGLHCLHVYRPVFPNTQLNLVDSVFLIFQRKAQLAASGKRYRAFIEHRKQFKCAEPSQP